MWTGAVMYKEGTSMWREEVKRNFWSVTLGTIDLLQ